MPNKTKDSNVTAEVTTTTEAPTIDTATELTETPTVSAPTKKVTKPVETKPEVIDNTDKLMKMMEDLKNSFESKLEETRVKAEKEKEELKLELENNSKIIELLQGENKKEDIIKEIDTRKAEAERLKKEKQLMQELNEANIKLQEQLKAKQELELKIETERKERELEIEKNKFKNLLLEEKANKPYLEKRINKILAEEDYNDQKDLYRVMTKLIDEEEEERVWKEKKDAGLSAFAGTRPSTSKQTVNFADLASAYTKNLLKSL